MRRALQRIAAAPSGRPERIAAVILDFGQMNDLNMGLC
jgi:hypothetical protein